MRSAELDFYSASSLKQQSAGRHVAPLGHIILIPSKHHTCRHVLQTVANLFSNENIFFLIKVKHITFLSFLALKINISQMLQC